MAAGEPIRCAYSACKEEATHHAHVGLRCDPICTEHANPKYWPRDLKKNVFNNPTCEGLRAAWHNVTTA